MTSWSGSRQPSCSQISYARVLEPSRVVRAQVDVDEAPALADRVADQLGAEAVDVVVVALDADELAAVDRGHDDLALLQVVRDEHAGAEAGAGGGGADGAGQVAGGGAGEGGEAEGAGGLDGDGDDAVLEGVRRVAGVVLDVQAAGDAQLAGEVVGLDELGEAGVDVGLGRPRRRGRAAAARSARCWRGRPRSACAAPRGRRSGRSYATRAARNTPRRRRSGRARTRSPHSRQESAAAGPRSTVAAEVGGACNSLRSHGGEALSPHLPHDASRHETELAPSRAGSLATISVVETGWRVAGASTGRSLCPSG